MYQECHIIPSNTTHGRSAEVQECWRALLGERVLLLEDEEAVCETIALAIGICEGTLYDLDQGIDDLTDEEDDRTATTAAATALTRFVRVQGPAIPVVAGQLPSRGAVTRDDGRL